jgi:hypothetical protein
MFLGIVEKFVLEFVPILDGTITIDCDLDVVSITITFLVEPTRDIIIPTVG